MRAYNGAVTSLDLSHHEHPAREAAAEALRAVAPALSALGQALAELREALPPEHRVEGERAFMNAFGNAVWADAHGRCC